MYKDITDDMGSDAEGTDVLADDSGVLTGEQVLELATMQPLLVYEQAEDKKVKVAVLEAVRAFHRPLLGGRPPRFSVRIQGVRKGELTYNARRTIDERPLVPVFCLMDADLVDRMRVSAEALALGQAAVDSLNPAPRINPMVDLLVTEYEESGSVEGEFFLPTEESDDDALPIAGNTPDRPTVDEVMGALGTTEPVVDLVADIDPSFYGDAWGTTESMTVIDHGYGFYNDPGFTQPATYGDPTTSPNFTGTITFGGHVQEQPAVNTEQLGTVEQVIAEPALIEDGDGVRVSDNLDPSAYQSPEALAVNPDRSPNSDVVDAAVEPMAVPGQGAEVYTVDPMGLPVIATTPAYGVQDDG